MCFYFSFVIMCFALLLFGVELFCLCLIGCLFGLICGWCAFGYCLVDTGSSVCGTFVVFDFELVGFVCICLAFVAWCLGLVVVGG